MDVGYQILSKCSWSYCHHPEKFTSVKSFTWQYDENQRLKYEVTNKISDRPEYLPLIQHGLHFLFSQNYTDNTFFKCLMIIGDCVLSLNHVNDTWFNLENAKEEFKEVERWQIHVLKELQTRKSFLLTSLQANETCLPIDLHTIIINYVFGITFLQL